MDSKKHRVIYRNKMYWTKKKKKDTIGIPEGRTVGNIYSRL